MARASGYGMKALDDRKPSAMPPSKSSPDSGKPGAQYDQKTSAATPGQNSISTADSGAPTANRNNGSNPADPRRSKKSTPDSGERDLL